MTVRQTKSEILRDVAAVVTVVISLTGLAIALSGQTSASAKWQQNVDGRLSAIETRNARADVMLNGRRGFMNEAANRANFLCDRSKECAARFQPMSIPE